jgi:hypothetical protein
MNFSEDHAAFIFSVKMVFYHITAWCHDPEDHNLSLHHHENLMSQYYVLFTGRISLPVLYFMLVYTNWASVLLLVIVAPSVINVTY